MVAHEGIRTEKRVHIMHILKLYYRNETRLL